MKSVNESKGFSKTIKRFGITEETLLYAQDIRKLAPRECYIVSGNQIKKAITLDSITIKLEVQLRPFLDDYYQQLFYFQQSERLALSCQSKDIKKEHIFSPKNKSGDGSNLNGGIDDLF